MSGEGNGKVMAISTNMARWLLPIVFGSGIAWAIVRELPKKQAQTAILVNNHEKRLSLVEKDIDYIKKGVDDIKAAMLHSPPWREHGNGRDGR